MILLAASVIGLNRPSDKGNLKATALKRFAILVLSQFVSIQTSSYPRQ
jgi:hypothetical protein